VADAERRVLVVDDEPHLLHAIQLYLEEEGFLVLTAADGKEALRRVRDQLPDVLVLDVQMPGMDGFETLQEIRKVSHAPVIMLTVRGEEQDKVRGLRLGAGPAILEAGPGSRRPGGTPAAAASIQEAGMIRRTPKKPPVSTTSASVAPVGGGVVPGAPEWWGVAIARTTSTSPSSTVRSRSSGRLRGRS
jgi:CheY-like chemotaxis protein